MTEKYIKLKFQKKQEWFAKNFAKLSLFLKHYGRLPTKLEDAKLCLWVSAMMKERKNKKLEQEFIDKLNTIEFPWDFKDIAWMDKARQTMKILTVQNRSLTYNIDGVLFSWLKEQVQLLEQNELIGKRKTMVETCKKLSEEINRTNFITTTVFLSGEDRLWLMKYKELLLFREKNPGKWPKTKHADFAERTLGEWCSRIKKKYRRNELTEVQLSNLKSINFNFGIKPDAWSQHFEKLKTYIDLHQELPDGRTTLRYWAFVQKNSFDSLSHEKQQLLHSIRFFDYFTDIPYSWKKKFAAVQNYIATYGKEPDIENGADLHKWIFRQRRRYKMNTLPENQFKLLQKAGIELSMVQLLRQTNWEKKYEALQHFRENNPAQWPSVKNKEERALATWCQLQRKILVGMKPNLKPLRKEQIDKLNEIHFQWLSEDFLDASWYKYFEELRIYLKDKETTYIPSCTNGKKNTLYNWLSRQKARIKKDKLPVEKIQKLKALGVL